MVTKINQLMTLVCIVGVTVFLVIFSQAKTISAAELSLDDCIKCHDNAPKDIEANGEKHKTNVTCKDCHQGHPPKVKEIIPNCNDCHSGEPHFELEGCLNCHTNPHTPLMITLAGDITEPCLTCHTEQIAQLKQHPSVHTTLACSNCHDKHGLIPQCQQCHEPHSQEMTQADCVTCHQAHMPLVVAYPEDVASKNCAACHEEAYDLLIASPAKHSQLGCATCHQAKHKMVPECQMCHGVPHPQGILSKFPKCGDCHGIAHNLNK